MVPTGLEKKRFVRDKFASVTHRYDFLNAFLSLYIDHYWRRVTSRELMPCGAGPFLDLCAGTLPLAREVARRTQRPVVAVDFCYEMLHHGAAKLQGGKNPGLIHPVCGDGEQLPLPSEVFEGVTIAFGIRNLSQPDKGLREMHRVLRPGGKVLILEFSRPQAPIVAPLYRFYLHKVLPMLAGTISGDKEAYSYLADSIQAFYDPPVLAKLMEEAGFEEVWFRPLTLGIVTLYSGRKPT